MCKDSNHWCILSNKWSVEGMNTIGHNHTGCGLMVGVFILHLERSGSSDSHSKTRVIHVVLLIAVTWHEVNKPTPETPFFHLAKKKKKTQQDIKFLNTKYKNHSRYIIPSKPNNNHQRYQHGNQKKKKNHQEHVWQKISWARDQFD